MPRDRLRLTRWFLFAIIASLVPFVFLCLGYRLAKHPESIWLLFRKGELLLVSFGLAGGSIADAALFRSKYRAAQLWCLVFCLFVAGVAAVGYTLVAVFEPIRFEYNPALVDCGSIALFIMVTICSGITATHSRI
ncbi:MAG TPA: hypothetical protein VFQ83_14810 [Candidatus Udaeobacter sp.]|jgi:hypothetical protein|nr:hypothetical protein [Candidatus Udaeobacter sp.]